MSESMKATVTNQHGEDVELEVGLVESSAAISSDGAFALRIADGRVEFSQKQVDNAGFRFDNADGNPQVRAQPGA